MKTETKASRLHDTCMMAGAVFLMSLPALVTALIVVAFIIAITESGTVVMVP